MTNRLVRSLIYSLIGLLPLACTVDSTPGEGTAGSTSSGGTGVIPSGGTGGTASAGASGSTAGGAPTAGTGGAVTGGAPTAGAGGQPGGAAGAAGTAGTGTAGTAGAGGGGDGVKSAGCGKQPAEEPRKYLQHDITVNVAPAYAAKFTNRKYYTYLPNNYDPNRAYPVVFYGAGCGAKMAENQPAMQAFDDNAILVFLLQVDSCFQAGSSGTADSPDIPYFDKALTEVQDNYCVDKNKVFMSGYSSGGWLSITLSCSHGDKLRAIAVAAGGQQPALPACKGETAALFFVSSGDGGNPISGPTGSGVARDRLLAANKCSNETVPWDARWPSCKKYTGCEANPVVFCDHGGGHSNGQSEKMATDGWWDFFMSLP